MGPDPKAQISGQNQASILIANNVQFDDARQNLSEFMTEFMHLSDKSLRLLAKHLG